MRFVGQDMRHSRELCRRPTGEFDGDAGDAIEAHEWKCVRTFNGIISCFKHVDEISLWCGISFLSIGQSAEDLCSKP